MISASTSLCALALCSVGQVRPYLDPDTRTTSGHVVLDGGTTPIKGANVEPIGFRIDPAKVITDESGLFTLHDGGRCVESNATANRGIEYVRISAPGFGVALVDPCAGPPWRDPVRLRPGAALSGRVEGVGKGRGVRVVAPARELIWPPCSGLTCLDELWTAATDEQGRFQFDDLPAQVPLTVSLDDKTCELQLALRPGEHSTISLRPNSDTAPRVVPQVDRSARWIPVMPLAVDGSGAWRSMYWFEFINAGRLTVHRVGGGRWHVHQHRACNHLEITPGCFTLVGRDASGWIGSRSLTIHESDTQESPAVILSPGALARVDGSVLKMQVHITVSGPDGDIAEFEMLPNAVRYELVPAGKVLLRIGSDAQPSDRKELDARAGEIIPVRL